MSDYINTRDLMLGETEDERAWQALNKLFNDELIDLTEDGVKTLKPYAIYKKDQLQSINLPSIQQLIQSYSISSLNNLYTLNIDNINRLGTGTYVLNSLPKLYSLKLPLIQYFGSSACNAGGPHILEIGVDAPLQSFSIRMLYNSFMRHLILRKNECIPLTNNSFFNDVYPFKYNDGCIYVPDTLVDTYKSATNWSNYADHIYPITLDTNGEVILKIDTISDTWEQILQAEQDGTYTTKYHIGDTKTVQIDGQNIQMRIIAFNTDILDDGNTAKITWMCKFAYVDSIKMSNSASITDWRSGLIYTFLNDQDTGLYTKIESTVKNAIKEVKKPYLDKNNTETTSLEKLWIFSSQEVNGNNTPIETTGVSYSYFDTNNSLRYRIFKSNNYDSYVNWWGLRTFLTSGYHVAGCPSGGISSINTSSLTGTSGLVFGFCT